MVLTETVTTGEKIIKGFFAVDFFGNDIGKASPDETGEGGVVHFYSLFLGVEFL